MAARRLLLFATLFILPLLAVSCGSDEEGGPGPGDTTPPTITQVSLADGQTDVGLIQPIDVTFSEAMDPSTIKSTTIMVAGRAPVGHVEYCEETLTASFVPDTLYAAEAWHDFVVSDSVTDEAGNPLAGPDTTAFETGSFDCEHLADCLELNDTVGEAAEIETDRPYYTLSACGDDDDYYVFTLDDTATVTVRTSVKYSPENESWGIHFLRTDGQLYATLGTTTNTGEEESFHFSFFPGTYAVKVFGYYDPVYVLYDLVLETGPPCREDEYEDNDFFDEAQPIATGTTTDLRGCYLDSDYYTFDVIAGQTVTITATQHPHAGSQHTIMAEFWADLDYDLEVAITD